MASFIKTVLDETSNKGAKTANFYMGNMHLKPFIRIWKTQLAIGEQFSKNGKRHGIQNFEEINTDKG
jgi:hypothetical protein